MSWRTFKIGDILKRRRETIKIVPERDYMLVTIRLYHKGVILRNISKGKNIKSAMSVVRTGDFILSGIDARNGAFGIVPKELDKAIVTNDFWCLDPDTEYIDKEFLLFLTSTDFFDYICKQSSDGTTQRIRLQKDKFFNFKISLPSIQEQKSLLLSLKSHKESSSVLSSEFSYQLDLVKQLRQVLLTEAMQGKLEQQNMEDGDARELLQKIKAENSKRGTKRKPTSPISEKEQLFEIPKNWTWCRLGDISRITRGKGPQYSEKGPKKMLNQKCVRWFYVDKQFAKAIDETWYNKISDEYRISARDVLVNSTGDGTIGRSAIADQTVNGFVFDSHILKVESSINQQYICYLINSPFGQNQIEQVKGATSTKQTELGVNNLSSFCLPLPPLREQARIVKKIQEVIKQCDLLEQTIEDGRKLNEKLLQQLLKESLSEKEIEVPLAPKEDKAYFKRITLANYIINHSLGDQNFGDVKFEKLLHIIDYAVIKRNLGQSYYQQAAGPYDNAFTHAYFEHISKQKLFARSKQGTQYIFTPGQQHTKSTNYYNYFSTEEFSKIDKMIAYFKTKTYEQPEIVSTLYAVWNNRVIRMEEITDELLIQDFYNWDEQKAKYERHRLVSALGWMRKENIIPDGWGKVIEKAKAKSVSKKKGKTAGK